MEEVIRDCLACQANTDTTVHAPLIIGQLPAANEELVSLDFSSKTPSDDYLLVANYEISRFPAYSISRNLTASQAIIHARMILVSFFLI